MAYCSKCGKKMAKDGACPSCGAGPSQSVLNKGISKVAVFTGDALEKTIKATENVYREVAPSLVPAMRKAASLTKKGISMARDETLKTARSLKEEGK